MNEMINEGSRISLSDLDLPKDLKELTLPQCKVLCGEIRNLLISTVSKTGGHLASNLGVRRMFTRYLPEEQTSSRRFVRKTVFPDFRSRRNPYTIRLFPDTAQRQCQLPAELLRQWSFRAGITIP